jgi:predicted alpha/beta superfamily hydrolase
MPFVRSPSVLSYQNDIEFMETTGRRLCWFINETSSSMDDKRKTKHEFIRQAIKEALARMKPELHAASDAAHQLFEEAEAED